MRLIHEPDFKSSYDVSVASQGRHDGRRGSVGSMRPGLGERVWSVGSLRGSGDVRGKPKYILTVNVVGKVAPIFVDLVKISEDPEFFAVGIKERFASILAAKSAVKPKKYGGVADVRVNLEVHGRKFAVALSGDDVNNSVVVSFESYTLKAIIDTEVCLCAYLVGCCG
jgi:hypothetical protein